ncbi:hypothetical protein LOB10_02155 [Lactobacillus delbrueckii subsp. lactis]|uniref:hypothetical protein n=1 Tax=Lactobacillus delbrueckii TaxID=1584 RepID=UPI001E518522|nr:hypothetical protein [Lactobacillus delbrueckii]MCD5528892.1 hypothetical protein [Lactobacillus delbrueckii subsp. lactis]MCS8607363.1 hypothetical protein [Lactobacillus delbrueckii subsp. lactis]
MAYSVTLSDGTKLDNLALNGNNFISSTAVEASQFDGKLKSVTITDSDGKEEKHENMVLVQVTHPNDTEWWFILADKSKDQLKQEQLEQSIASLTDMIMTLPMGATK